MKRRILKAISLICACVMLLTLAACGEESQDNTGKYILDISKEDVNQVTIKTSKPIIEGKIEIEIEKRIRQRHLGQNDRNGWRY